MDDFIGPRPKAPKQRPKEVKTNFFIDKQAFDKRLQSREKSSSLVSGIHEAFEHGQKEEITTKHETKPKKRRFSHLTGTKRGLLKILTIVVSVFCIGALVYLYIAREQGIPPSLPQDTISSLNYQVFYPTRIPKGYSYKKGTATSHNGLLFYKFVNGKKVITITEQAAPPKYIDLNKIVEGYTALKVPIGRAAVGTSVGNPSVIIITDTTLINITSSKGVAKNQVTSLAQKMKLVESPGLP